MTPDIFHGVGDYVRRQPGPGHARRPALERGQVIVQAGVHFMAETSKVLTAPRRRC